MARDKDGHQMITHSHIIYGDVVETLKPYPLLYMSFSIYFIS